MWEFSNGGGEGHGIKNIFNPNLSSDKCKGCAGFINVQVYQFVKLYNYRITTLAFRISKIYPV
jgi:hypothetical protein